ncbi:MAG: GxxExxY protein [Planctomycetota bacterium]
MTENELTETIIGAAFRVQNSLGVGFLEKVYENALARELAKTGLGVEQQKPTKVWYDDAVVGEYVADLVVDSRVIVELKAVKALDNIHVAQCLNYLRATGLGLGLLLNFGSPRVEVKRLRND